MTQTELLQPLEVTIENLNANPANPLFHDLFLQATEKTFNLLGNKGKTALYRRLENKYGLPSTQIPDSVEAFTKALEDTFGQAAHIIEMQIMQALHESVPHFKVTCRETLSFADYVESLRLFL